MAALHGIQDCFIIIQNRYAQATEELSRFVIETAKQRPAGLKDFRTQELAVDVQTRLLELSKFPAICRLRDEIAKKFCRFQVPNS
jgi:hypothetical protein